MDIKKVRDLIIISIDEEKSMVIACDSIGSIGNKEYDALKVEPFITGKYGVRVGLLEVMAANAQVVTVIDNVCAEMEPTGREIIRGIESELHNAGLTDIALGGSTEENFPTFSTGLGVTVIGIAKKKDIKVNKIKAGGVVYSIGTPKVGSEINYYEDKDIFQYHTLKELLGKEEVYEIVPVGSKGILYEALELAKNNDKAFNLEGDVSVDVHRSAGPATVAIVCADEAIEEEIKQIPNSCKIGVIK